MILAVAGEIEIHCVLYVVVYIVMLFLMLFYDCDASILSLYRNLLEAGWPFVAQ